MECAHYDDIAGLLDDHGCASLAELQSRPAARRWVAQEWVAIDGAPMPHPGVVKLTSTIQRQPYLTREQFCAHYQNVHAPLVRRTPLLVRYVQNYLIDAESAGSNSEFDAVAELWWNDRESAEQSWSSPQIQDEQARDMPNFMTLHSVFMFGDEVHCR
jgi:uncharacterized protein (TIGR02118 family)